MVPTHPSLAGSLRARSLAPSHIRRRETRLTARLGEFRAKLEDIHAKRKREFMTFRDRALNLIQEFKDNCYNITLEEEQCLNQLKSMDFSSLDMNPLHSVLKDCGKDVPERVKFAKNGLVVSFEPEPDTITDPLPHRPPPPPPLSATSMDRTTGQLMPPNPSTPRRGQPRQPLLPHAGPTSTSSTPPAPTNTLPRLPGGLLTSTKQKRQIKPAHVKKGKYWVFEHGSKARSKMYILRCPNTSCQQPVFSKHPFRQNRAHDHFKACKVPFKSDADIVKRYAQLVVQERRSRPLTREWSKKHNATLIGRREDSLHADNIWSGID
ncbi:hypothetical protein V8F33_012553 [Rhypophila sp. PSN 637]